MMYLGTLSKFRITFKTTAPRSFVLPWQEIKTLNGKEELPLDPLGRDRVAYN